MQILSWVQRLLVNAYVKAVQDSADGRSGSKFQERGRIIVVIGLF